MEILRFTFCFFCCADSNFCQNRGERRLFGFGYSIRTSVILFITWGMVLAGNHQGEVKGISGLRGYSSSCPVLLRVFRGCFISRRCRWAMCRVAPIDKLNVVITICLSFLFLKEPVSLRVIAGALLITRVVL